MRVAKRSTQLNSEQQTYLEQQRLIKVLQEKANYLLFLAGKAQGLKEAKKLKLLATEFNRLGRIIQAKIDKGNWNCATEERLEQFFTQQADREIVKLFFLVQLIQKGSGEETALKLIDQRIDRQAHTRVEEKTRNDARASLRSLEPFEKELESLKQAVPPLSPVLRKQVDSWFSYLHQYRLMVENGALIELKIVIHKIDQFAEKSEAFLNRLYEVIEKQRRTAALPPKETRRVRLYSIFTKKRMKLAKGFAKGSTILLSFIIMLMFFVVVVTVLYLAVSGYLELL